jgi:ferredoxin-NADP reductase
VRVGRDADDNPILRSYSLASHSGLPELSLILKLIEHGPGSQFFARLAVGQRVQFTGPMGFFVLDLQHAGDVVFGVTGVGITPVLPMLAELAARAERGKVIVYWGNRHAADLFWLDELRAVAAQNPRIELRLFLSGDAGPNSGDWHGRRGRINAELLADSATLTKPVFYLVGNGAMIKELKADLQARGVDRKRQIRNEAFFG